MKRKHPWTEQAVVRYTNTVVEAAPPAHRALLLEFAAWLEHVRGNALSSVELRVRSARSFLEVVAANAPLIGALRALDAARLESFFVDFCAHAGRAARRTMQAGLRNFLRFARDRGYCCDLVAAVPSLSVRTLCNVPSHVSQAELSRLLERVARPGVPARTRAIIYLLAVYGVRRGQIARLKLGDLDWRAQSVTFAPHKGGRPIRHQLTGAVAKALADYLRFERPASDESAVFLRWFRPHLPMSPSAITAVVYSQSSQLGLDRRVGPHALRHTFATRLLRAGQPMKTISDLLGHRCLQSTGIYAKLDHPHLVEVAGEWPGAPT
jgi:integrase